MPATGSLRSRKLQRLLNLRWWESSPGESLRVRSIDPFEVERGPRLPDGLIDVVNVLDHGAVGDGAALDTSSIQSALDSADGIVFVPPGTFLAANLSIPANVTLCGPGTLKLPDGTNGTLVTLTGDDAAMCNLVIDGNSTNQSDDHTLIVVSGERCTLSGLRITDARHKHVSVEQSAISTLVSAVIVHDSGVDDNCNAFDIKGSYSSVQGCIVRNLGNGWGVRVGRFSSDADEITEHVAIEGCIFEGTDHVAFGGELDSRYCTFSGNHVADCDQGAKFDGGSGTSAHHVIAGNVFSGVTQPAFVINGSSGTDLSITGNLIHGSSGGIYGGTGSLVADNRIEGSDPVVAQNAIRVLSQSIARDNEILNFETSGQIIRADGPTVTVAGNILDSCDTQGSSSYIRAGVNATAAIALQDNIVRSPASSEDVFFIDAVRGVCSGNILDGANITSHRGVRVSSGSDRVAVVGNVVDQASDPLLDDGTNTVTSANVTA